MAASGKKPQDEMQQPFLPEKGLNRLFFRSELPKVLLVIVAVMLVQSFIFEKGDASDEAVDTWLAMPIVAADESTFMHVFDATIAAAPSGFKDGMKEHVRFLGYAVLRAESERQGMPVPEEATSPSALFFAGRVRAHSMSQTTQPFTLMCVVREEGALSKAYPGWKKDFLTLVSE